jgi:hypothetical protein
MATFPTPKAKLLITRNESVLSILVASEDARHWIETEAPKFGGLCRMMSGHEWILYINTLWDSEEVERYLLSYLKDA